MSRTHSDDRSLVEALLGDGRPLLLFTGLALVLSGVFALFLSATGHFLPHDVKFLGMTERDLCAINECRIVHFMFHDRVSFGGVLVAIGAIYLWLAEFPLKAREPWAWWTLLISGVVGFASFLTYLGYGYLDSWHGAATLLLLPCFGAGLALSYRRLEGDRSFRSLFENPIRSVLFPRDRFGVGRLLLCATAIGLIGGGLTIMTVGMTVVFVPQDLTYMGMSAAELRAVNPRLVPLIAHDRAGFGGGVAVSGVLLLLCVQSAAEPVAVAGALPRRRGGVRVRRRGASRDRLHRLVSSSSGGDGGGVHGAGAGVDMATDARASRRGGRAARRGNAGNVRMKRRLRPTAEAAPASLRQNGPIPPSLPMLTTDDGPLTTDHNDPDRPPAPDS